MIMGSIRVFPVKGYYRKVFISAPLWCMKGKLELQPVSSGRKLVSDDKLQDQTIGMLPSPPSLSLFLTTAHFPSSSCMKALVSTQRSFGSSWKTHIRGDREFCLYRRFCIKADFCAFLDPHSCIQKPRCFEKPLQQSISLAFFLARQTKKKRRVSNNRLPIGQQAKLCV